jgi:hypothetical protein
MRTMASLSGGVSVVALVLTASCAVQEARFIPRDVYVRPEARFADHERIVVFVDMAALPEQRREPAIVWGTEEALRKRGFDIIDHNAYMRFLKLSSPAPSSFDEPRMLAKLRDELGRSAVVHVLVRDFLAAGRMADRGKIVTPGVPGVRAASLTPLEEGLHDRREWAIDLSMALEMIDTLSGARIWTCSVESRRTPYDGRIRDFIRKAVAACLETIPPR